MKNTITSALIVLCMFAFAYIAQSQSYTITDLGGLLGTNSYAYGINNQGQVVGYWSDTNGARAFLYSGGAVTDLGSLGGTNQYALSINSSGQIVGFAAATNGVRAFLYSNGSLTNLGPMGGLNSYAYGINDSGQIVGYLDTTNGARAYIYGGNGVTNLGTLGGTNSFAFGVNTSNLVVGSSLTVAAVTHAFLWQNGGLTNLNSLLVTNSGWVLNDARGINNGGKIVGWGLTNGQEQAFVYAGGQITRVGMLSGATNSFAFGINNSNQVVGASTLSNSTSRAFVWLNGTLTDLNTLLPAGFNWDLREARGINDNGQIVGWGVTNGQEHAFILSPNHVPSVSLTNPVGNAVFAASTSITLQASASDSDGSIAKVEFYQGTTKLGEATTSPYQMTWSSVSAGSYTLTAKAIDNSGATNVSAAISITVAIAPTISTQPQSQSILTSSNVTFSVTAAGATPLSYQWRFNGVNIAGATGTNYSIVNVQTVHAGSYSVVVTNIASSLTSSSAVLTVKIDPKNIGKGDWIYFLSDATNRLGQNVNTVTDIPSLMNYERLQGMQFIVVKCGDGGTIWNQFDAALVAQAHAAGLKIFGYGRVYGTNIFGEISVATNALALGADGFVIDAEIEYESQNLANNSAAATQYCQGIRSAYPNAFLAHSPFVYISSHSTFPYIAFGTNCDVVMPQCYWKSFGITASNMVSVLNTEWKNWQNSLTGANTNAIKPIAPIGQGWSVSLNNATTGTEIADFVNRLKATATPATSGGYKGVSFWRADLHTPDMWDRIASLTIGNANGAPLITAQPVAQVITNGLTASFSVQATGVAPLTYQWRQNGVSISGATVTGYTITNVQSANVGVYSVIVSNASGVVLSSDAILSIPSYVFWTETFETGLTNWTTVSGGSALTNSSAQNHTMSGTNSAKMGSTLNKMYRNTGAEIAGNAKATFWIYDSGNSSLRALGEVRAYSDSGYGSGSLQQILAIGAYRVGFGTGGGNLSSEVYDSNKYQGRVYAGSDNGFFNLNATNCPNRSTGWHKFEIERLSNETTINFYVDNVLGRTITNTTAATWDTAAMGSVVAGSTAGDAWFDDIKVEYFGSPIVVTQPLDRTVNAGTNVAFTVSAAGNDISGYQWRFNGVNISGATTTSLTLFNVQSTNAGDYTVVIRNPVGATVSATAILTVLYPPIIVTQPANQTGNAGGSATFRVVPGGPGPFTYQWKKNGIALNSSSNILNATTDQLTLTNLTAVDEGAYSATVSNSAGSVNSASALLTVDTGVIFSDTFEGGLANWSPVPGATSLAVSTIRANPVSGSQAAYETNSLNKMYHNLGTKVSGRSRATFWIYNGVNSPTRSFGEVRSFTGSGLNSGSLEQVLAVGHYTVPFDLNTGTLTNEDRNTSLYQARVYSGLNSGWFNLNAPGAPSWTIGWHKFSIEKSSNGSAVHFFIDGVFGRTINDVTPAAWDVVEIGAAGIGSGIEEAAWFDDVKVEALTNVITGQPASIMNAVGTTASFNVSASGSGLTYQWRKGGTAISGATLPSYSITNVQNDDEADYSVLVATSTDREYSTLAHLTLLSSPVIIIQPESQNIGAGSNVAFSVSASGEGLSYQWKKNGANLADEGKISGAKTANLALSGVTQSDAANYTVVISNPADSITSTSAFLTVINPPIISVQPQSQTAAVGGSVTLTVTVNGTSPFIYQWKKNGAEIAGATNASLPMTALALLNSGNYSVVVVNAAGADTSSPARMSVISPPAICTQPTNLIVNAGQNAQFTVGICTSGPAPLPVVTSGNLRLWLKADQGVVMNSSGLVSTWQDQSGNGNDAVQGTDTNKPTWVDSAVFANGKPVLRFNGIQNSTLGSYLRGTNNLGITNAYTSFIVYSRTDHNSAGEKALVYIGVPSSYNNVRGCYIEGDQMAFSAWANDYGTPFSVTNDTYRIWSTRMNTNKTSVESFDADVANRRSFTNAVSNIGVPASGYYVGGLGAQALNFKGDVAEVIYYRGSLSDVDRQAIENYLYEKYFITNTSDSYGYQWQKNGTNLVDQASTSGANTMTLHLGNVGQINAGSYTAVITNLAGPATSSPAVLTVVVPPAIVVQPSSQVICSGDNCTLTVVATGTALQYQWRLNGVSLVEAGNCSGSKTAVLNIGTVSARDAGLYSVSVTNAGGTILSSSASVAVNTPILVDLDIDSGNTNILNAPIRSQAEEVIEADTSKPGKYISVNDGDADNDGIPDFADGFDYLGNQGANRSAGFVPLILHLAPSDVLATKIKFSYAASNPALITNVPDAHDGYVYVPAPGTMRIWTKDGAASRIMRPVDGNGDYVAPDVFYSLSDLGFSRLNPVITLYVEGIRPSPSGGETISVEVDKDGYGQGCSQSDLVRVSVDRDSDRDGLVNRWEDEIGTDSNRVDTDGDSRSDFEEIWDGTDPKSNRSVIHQRLLHLTFADRSLNSDEGAVPSYQTGYRFSVDTNAIALSWDDPSLNLLSPQEDIQTGVGYPLFRAPSRPNLTPNRGTVSFWFQPNWESRGAFFDASAQSRFTLLSLEQRGTNDFDTLKMPFWGLELNGQGTNLCFAIAGATDTNVNYLLSCGLEWVRRTNDLSNAWHNIALAYSETNIQLFVDGEGLGSVASTELGAWPGTLMSTNPWRLWVGGRQGENLANGSFDDLQTFNYVLSTNEVYNIYRAVADRDTDRDGLTDLDELRRGLSPRDPDTDADGMPDGWEIVHGLNPRSMDAQNDPDGDLRRNLHEFLFGTDPHLSNIYSSAIDFDLVGVSSNKAILINIDFGSSSKPVLQRGPAAAGIDTNDQWVLWPVMGYKNPLKDASGANSELKMSSASGPIVIIYHGYPNLDDPTSGELCEPFENFGCQCLNLCQLNIEWFSPVNVESGVNRIGPKNGFGNQLFGDWHQNVDSYNHGWYPHYPPVNVPTPPRLPKKSPPSCGDLVACVSADPCAMMYRLDHMVRDASATPDDPDSDAGYINLPESYKQSWMFDTPNYEGAATPMLSDFSTSSLDANVASSFGKTNSADTNQWWRADVRDVRARILLTADRKKSYRVYLYGGPDQTSEQQLISFANGRRAEMIRIPGGYSAGGYIEGVNYVRFLIQPTAGYICLDWVYKNSALRGMQVVELQPMQKPVARAHSLLITGPMIEWDPVPQALGYNLLRKASSETNYTQIGSTTGTSFQDYSVLPFDEDPSSYPRTYSYVVQAINELYSTKSDSVDASVQWTLVPGHSVGNYQHAEITNNQAPVLNSISPMAQAYERTPFAFGAGKIQAAASAFDFEGAPLQFVITRINCGTVKWIEESDGVEEILTNEKIASELNSGARLRIIRPDVTVRWTPPDGAIGDVIAMKVRAFDGVSVSGNAVDLPINVKPQTVLLWWGNYTYGMSGGGSAAQVPLQSGVIPWRGVPNELFCFEKYGYSKIPFRAVVNPDSAAQFQTNEYTPMVDGNLRNVVSLSGSSSLGPVGNRLALTTDGSVWTWGIGRYGQMADGMINSPDPTNNSMLPWFSSREQPLVTRVAGISNAVSIAGNGNYSLVAESDGSVWGWGPSVKGYPYHHWTQYTWSSGLSQTFAAPFYAPPFDDKELSFYSAVTYNAQDWNANIAGRFNPDNSIFAGVNKPVKIPGLENIVQVAASAFYSAALSSDGKVYFWGFWDWLHGGENGETADIKALSGIHERVVQIAAGEWFLVALTESGKVYQWNHTDTDAGPTLVEGVVGAKQISAQYYDFLALLGNGRVMQWGAMGRGNPPYATYWPYMLYPEPEYVPGLVDIVSISAGFQSCFASDKDGQLWGWGVDSHGIFGRDYEFSGAGPEGNRTWMPRNTLFTPVRIGTVKEVAMAQTFDMNVYASAIVRDVPQNLAAKPADHAVILSWDTFAGVQQYIVKRAATLEDPFLPVGTAVNSPSLERQSYTDADVVNFQSYFYRVAIIVNGQEQLSDPVRVTPQPPPSVPLGLSAVAKSRQIRVTWSAKIVVDSYRVWRSRTSDSSGFSALVTVMNQFQNENRQMFIDDANLVPGTTNWYRLQAINAGGESELTDAVSAVVNDLGPNPPSSVSAIASDTSVKLTWTAPVDTNGSASYIVYKAKASCTTNQTLNPSDQALKWEFVAHTAGTTNDVTGLVQGHCYAFAVSTVDDRGEGAISTPITTRPGGDLGFPEIKVLEQVVGPGSIYLKWQCPVDLFVVSARSGPTNGVVYPLCGHSETHVFPDESGFAELWLTDVAPGFYNFTIVRVTDTQADSQGINVSVQVTNGAPSRAYGYPMRPLLATSASNRVELSWWGTTQADAKSALDEFNSWHFILLRQEAGIESEGFPCDNFVYIGEGTGVTFSDTNVINGHTYQYQLIGLTPESAVYQRALGDSPGITNTSVTPAAAFGPAAGLTLNALSLNGAVQLTWNMTNWVLTDLQQVKVELFCSRGHGEPYDLLTNVTSDHVYLHDHLDNGTTYYYKVRALHKNGDSLEKDVTAIPSADQPLVAPQNFTAGIGVGKLMVQWKDVAAASAYKVQKWNATTSQYTAFSSVALPQFVDALGGLTAAYRYRVSGISGGQEGLATDIRVQPLTWTWSTNALPSPAPVVTRFEIQRQCPGANGWITIGTSTYLQYVDVRTECVDSSATYRIVPVADGVPDESLAFTPVQIKAGDAFLTLPPQSINTFVDGTNVNEHGEIVIRLLDFESATNAASAVVFTTPTNLMLHASVSFAPNDPSVKLEYLEFYADGELLTVVPQLPYDYTWRNPAGTISGRTYQLKVRVVDSLGRSKDSPVFYAKVRNLPPLKAFMTSVNDLQVSAPGVPLSLSRSYNSQDPSVGLLGKGWKTPWDQAHVFVPNLADGWVSKRTIISAQPFDIQETTSHRVEVALPGGGAEHFRLTPTYPTDNASRQAGVSGINIGFVMADVEDDFVYRLPFVFAPEADAMGNLTETQGATVLQVGGQNFILDGYANTEVDVNLSRGEKVSFVPDSFLYTASDGSVYEFGQRLATSQTNVNESCLISISDRNGNKVSYGSTIVGTNRVFSGISHSNGRSLLWTNETISGTAYICVYDPIALATSGAKPVIRYKVENDLLREVQHLRSRAGASDYDVTTYEYFQGLTGSAVTLNGMLKRVISSEGSILLENDYFGTAVDDPPEYLGFLKSQKDVVGVSASLEHEADEVTGDLTSTVMQSIPGASDAPPSEAVYDSSGKPVTVTDESGQSTSMGYDEKGRLAFTQNEAGDYKGFNYDDKNRPIAVTDELGNQTQVRYGALDQPTDTIDAAGEGTHYEYYHYNYGHTANDPNPEGALRSVRDPAGVTTEYTYDKHGQVLTESRLAPGNVTPSVTTYEYYLSGDLKVVKEPLWPGGTSKLYTTEYSYDENGNRKTEKRHRNVLTRNSDGETNGVELETVCSTYNYDAQGRVLTSTTSVETSSSTNTLQTTSSHYNLAGKVDYTLDAYGRKTEMLYDVRGNLIETTYVDGAVTRTVYDARGRAVWQQERCMPSSGLTTAPATLTEYDAGGRVVAVKRYGNLTLQKSTATPKSELQSITDSQTQYRRSTAITSPQDQYTITVSGSVAADAFLSISRTVYDNLGRVRYSMDTRGVVTGYAYDAVGRRTNVTVYTSYTVPGLINNISPTGSHTDTAYGYDENGNQVWVTDALGNRTDFEYDAMNRRTITRFPAVEGDSSLRRYRKTIYDPLGRRTGEVDEAGVVTAFGYDVLGRLTAVTNDFRLHYPSTETAIVTTYGYDAFGNETSQTDAQGRTTFFEYDALGRRTHRLLPSGTPTDTADNINLERTYYSQVQVQASPPVYAMRKQVRDFRGRTNTYDFDILDRLVKTTPSDTDAGGNSIAVAERTTVDYTYNGNGQRAQVVQSVGTTRTVRYAYDMLGRLRVKDTPEGTLTYDYESSGALSRISARYSYTGWGSNPPYNFESLTAGSADTTRAEWNYRYDSLGRLQKVNPDSTNALASADATYSYTDVGNLNTTTYRNGLVTTYNYNKRNWLRNLETKNGAGTRVALFDYDATGWSAQNRLSPTGQRRCVQEIYGDAARTVTYAYDRLSRLLTENIVTNSTPPIGVVSYDRASSSDITQGYDLVGNRLSRRLIDDHGLATAGVKETTLTYDSHDLISTTEYLYDASGNTTRDTAGANYIYDAENRLIKRTGGTIDVAMPDVSIVYDADGNRVSKTKSDGINLFTTTYLVEDRNPTGYAQVMEEWASTNSESLTLNGTYVYGLDLISQKQSGNVTYYGYDGLGSTRYLSDSNTNITDTYTYDAFGIQIASTGTRLNNYRYTGEQWDPDLGMYYLRARYYRPGLGRFWTMDSFEGGQDDPLSLHKYLYVAGNSVNQFDPSGHESLPSLMVGFTIRAIMFRALMGAAVGVWDANFRGYSQWEGLGYGAVSGIIGPLIPWQLGVTLTAYGIAEALQDGNYESAIFRGAVLVLGPGTFRWAKTLRGGRLGNLNTQLQNLKIALYLKARGWKIRGGGGMAGEERIPGPGGGREGETWVDITAEKPIGGVVRTLRIQTVDTYASGAPKPRELSAAARIRDAFPSDKLILVPKANAGTPSAPPLFRDSEEEEQ